MRISTRNRLIIAGGYAIGAVVILGTLSLLGGCESARSVSATEPGWHVVEFIAIPRAGGGTCYVAKPERVTNWVATYAEMARQCAEKGTVEMEPEMDT